MDKKYVHRISIVFENCESIDNIKIDDIDSFYIKYDDIVQKWAVDCIEKYPITKDVYITLSKSADREYYAFGDKEHFDKSSVFERILSYNDITQIHITYEDDTEETYLVSYDEPYDCLGAPNLNQSVKLDDEGNLNIIIKKCNIFKRIYYKSKYGIMGYINQIKWKIKRIWRKF